MSVLRSFIAIDIPKNKELKAFHQELHQYAAGMKVVSLDNLHLTLKFLGDIDQQQLTSVKDSLNTILQHYSSFSIQLQGTGAFPNNQYIKVIWVGIQNGTILDTIARNIDHQLSVSGIQKNKRPFSPHLTLARVKYLKQKQDVKTLLCKYQDHQFGANTVSEIHLYQSTLTPKGPIYTRLHTIHLHKES